MKVHGLTKGRQITTLVKSHFCDCRHDNGHKLPWDNFTSCQSHNVMGKLEVKIGIWSKVWSIETDFIIKLARFI